MGAYQEAHCWQYDIRIKNLKDDLLSADLTKDEASRLRVHDFEFLYVPKEHGLKCAEIQWFIKRHEWLGKMPMRPTHRFIALYKGSIAGAVVMATPNAFSKIFGQENRHREKLISRGACISWSPKNLGSALIMFAVRWMAKNTEFRFFTAYSDVDARELGTIYQACNFNYLGQRHGAREEYLDSVNPMKGWFSDRQFRKSSQIHRYAKELGIVLRHDWYERDKILLDKIPLKITMALKEQERRHRGRCIKRYLQPKHKYVLIQGATKKETRRLREEFKSGQPDLHGLQYPKIRGPQSTRPTIFNEKRR